MVSIKNNAAVALAPLVADLARLLDMMARLTAARGRFDEESKRALSAITGSFRGFGGGASRGGAGGEADWGDPARNPSVAPSGGAAALGFPGNRLRPELLAPFAGAVRSDTIKGPDVDL